MNNSNMKSILIEYQKRRDKNIDLLESRKKEIENLIPEIKDINMHINSIGLNISKEILKGSDKKNIDLLKAEQKNLIEHKRQILKSQNIPSDYLEIKYDCNQCKDTGFLKDGSKCNCLKQIIINNAYKMSNIEKILEKENFNTFNLNHFSEEVDEEMGISPRDNMINIVKASKEFIYNFDKKVDPKKANMLFFGSTGLGKSFLCSCIAKELMDSGYTVIYQTSFNLMEIIEKYKFHRKECTDIDEENFKNLFECDLLIIDDLGTELTNNFTISELFNIINDRLLGERRIIISTNLDLLQIGNEYTDRTISRIIGNFSMYKFMGKDIRLKQIF